MRILKKVGGSLGKSAAYIAFRAIPGHKRIRRKFDQVDKIYEDGKKYLESHDKEARAVKWIARKVGGEKGKKIADTVDKVQNGYKKITGKIDNVRDTAKEIVHD